MRTTVRELEHARTISLAKAGVQGKKTMFGVIEGLGEAMKVMRGIK